MKNPIYRAGGAGVPAGGAAVSGQPVRAYTYAVRYDHGLEHWEVFRISEGEAWGIGTVQTRADLDIWLQALRRVEVVETPQKAQMEGPRDG